MDKVKQKDKAYKKENIQTVYITQRQQDNYDARCPKCGSIHTHLIAENKRYFRFGKERTKTKMQHLCSECGYRYR